MGGGGGEEERDGEWSSGKYSMQCHEQSHL